MPAQPPRTAKIKRKTNETDVSLSLSLEPGDYKNQTGVGFLDHMLDHVARHARFALTVKVAGDTHVDDHHTVEDTGIVLGQALEKALGDKRGIERYGFASVPMEDALARVSIDLSGRPCLVFDVPQFRSTPAKIGAFDNQLVEEFLTALVNHARLNCHVEVPQGQNHHHIAEAIFKALGRALHQATTITHTQIPSTKGSL